MLKLVLGLMVVCGLAFAIVLGKDYFKKSREGTLEKGSFFTIGFIGALANFFDTLGIGSFAIETSFFKNLKLVDDKQIPGTLNVGATIPTIFEAFIFLQVIKVEPVTLFSMIAAAVVGAVLGASVVSKLNKNLIQIGMGIALIVIAFFMLSGLLNLYPSGGTLTGLTGTKLIIGLIGSFIFGALNTLGIGAYAPVMAMVFALGMDPKVAFPIMMGQGALLLPFAAFKFIKEGAHSTKASASISIMGPIGVLIAAFIVKTLPLTALKWVVMCVLLYTSWSMFKSARERNRMSQAEKAAA